MSKYKTTMSDLMLTIESKKALDKKAKKSGMPKSILSKVYDRGMAAWKGGHRPGTTPQQWALARVNSFITKSSGTWGGADKDLAKQVRGEEFDLELEYHLEDLDEGTMRVSGIKYGSHNEYFKGVIKKELPNLVAKSSPNTSDVITFSGSKSDLQKLADIAKKRDYRVGDIKEELDENLDVRYDTKKQGWFDRQGKRRYLGIGQTNTLMKKALDKAIKTGDFINPFKMKHGQKAEAVEESSWE